MKWLVMLSVVVGVLFETGKAGMAIAITIAFIASLIIFVSGQVSTLIPFKLKRKEIERESYRKGYDAGQQSMLPIS